MSISLGDHQTDCLSNLRFADDVLLIAASLDHLKRMMTDFKRSTEKVGLKIHKNRTKILSNQRSNRQKRPVDFPFLSRVEGCCCAHLLQESRGNQVQWVPQFPGEGHESARGRTEVHRCGNLQVGVEPLRRCISRRLRTEFSRPPFDCLAKEASVPEDQGTTSTVASHRKRCSRSVCLIEQMDLEQRDWWQ